MKLAEVGAVLDAWAEPGASEVVPWAGATAVAVVAAECAVGEPGYSLAASMNAVVMAAELA